MLARLPSRPLALLTLSARDHARLNASMMDRIRTAMEADDWTCHACKIRLPGMMEIDHLGGHVPACTRLQPICQFCHDRQHPLWAASRRRIVPVLAPDFSLEDLSILAWTLLVHAAQDGFRHEGHLMARDWTTRHEHAVDILGHGNAEAIFEAVLALDDRVEARRLQERLSEIDRHVRFAPAVLLEQSRDIQVWRQSGFTALEQEWAANLVPPETPYAQLRQAGDELRGRGLA